MRVLIAFLCVAAFLSHPWPAAAQDERLHVVASFSILADVVHNVANMEGGPVLADITTLIPVGADPHSYEPSARDLAALQSADVVFVAGAGFEGPLLDLIRSTAPDVPIVEASACVPIRPFTGADDDDHDDDTPSHGSFEDALGVDLTILCTGYDTYLAELDALKADMGVPSARASEFETLGPLYAADCASLSEEGDHHHVCDPHVWTDPRSVYYWTLYVRDTLSALDPANAVIYHANAEAYLYAMDDFLRFILEPMLADIPTERRVLVTNHDTLGYFAAAYGFEVVGFVMPGGAAMAEPSAQDMAALIQLVRERDVPAIFTESTLSGRVAEQVAAETGVAVYPLYADSLSEENGVAVNYLEFVISMFETIADALAP
jgi:ABC-type Zn uptake system ZnuABC Zn-binding protein ZnuA